MRQFDIFLKRSSKGKGLRIIISDNRLLCFTKSEYVQTTSEIDLRRLEPVQDSDSICL